MAEMISPETGIDVENAPQKIAMSNLRPVQNIDDLSGRAAKPPTIPVPRLSEKPVGSKEFVDTANRVFGVERSAVGERIVPDRTKTDESKQKQPFVVDLISPVVSAVGKGCMVSAVIALLAVILLVALLQAIIPVIGFLLVGTTAVFLVVAWRESRKDLVLLRTYIKLLPSALVGKATAGNRSDVAVSESVSLALASQLRLNLGILASHRAKVRTYPDSTVGAALRRVAHAEMAVRHVQERIRKDYPNEASGNTAQPVEMLPFGLDRAVPEGSGIVLKIRREFVKAMRYFADQWRRDRLLEVGEEVFTADRNGFTALHVAKTRETALALLIMGADPNYCQGENGQTPLYQAVVCGRLPVVEALLEYGADPNKPSLWALDGITPLQSATYHSDAVILRLLLKYGATLPVRTNDDGKKDNGSGLFHVFAASGSTEGVEALLELGACPNVSSVSIAAQWGHDDLARRLTREVSGFPVHIAVCLGEVDIVVKHLDKLDALAVDHPTREKLLFWALAAGKIRPAKLLLERGASLHALTDNAVFPSILGSCTDVDVIELVLEHGLGINSCGARGTTMLHMAAYSCNIPAVRYLLTSGADPAVRNKDGERAIDMGCGYLFMKAKKSTILRLLRVAMLKKRVRSILRCGVSCSDAKASTNA